MLKSQGYIFLSITSIKINGCFVYASKGNICLKKDADLVAEISVGTMNNRGHDCLIAE